MKTKTVNVGSTEVLALISSHSSAQSLSNISSYETTRGFSCFATPNNPFPLVVSQEDLAL